MPRQVSVRPSKIKTYFATLIKVFLDVQIKALHQVLSEIFLFLEFFNLIGYLVRPDQTHQKWYYQLVKIFDVYLHKKNLFHTTLLSLDITL